MTKENNVEKKPSEIALIDSNFDLSELKKHIKNTTHIITLDFESHKKLEENQIKHESSESYLEPDDFKMIQEKSYHFAKWFEKDEISKNLSYEGINTGNLFYIEFHFFLLPFIKKFVEIIKICMKYKQQNFIVSPQLEEMVKICTLSVKTFGKKEKYNPFIYDKVRYPITNSLSITLSKKKYQNFKSLSEKLFSTFFVNNKNTNSNNKNILLVEFDPIRYRDLFFKSKKNNIDIILFNRRRPSIWNVQSFSIIKKSKCSIITSQTLINKNLTKKIKQFQNVMQKNINIVLDNEIFFNNYFSILGYSFWSAIKSNFSQLLEKRVLEAVNEIELTKSLLSKISISSILVWSESGFNEQIIIHLAKKFGIPTVLLQHGVYNDDKNSYEFNFFSGNICNLCDKFAVWGNTLAKYAVAGGVPEQKIVIIGSPSYDNTFELNKKHRRKKNDYILLATTAPRQIHVSGHQIDTNEFYETVLTSISKTVISLNKNLVIKLHPFQYEHNITNLIHKIHPEIKIIQKGDILPLIANCDIFLTISTSSTILEGQILGKPVINIKTNYDAWGVPYVLRNGSCVRIPIDEFKETLELLILNDKLRNDVIENGNRSVNDYLSNHGNASNELLKYLASL